MGAREKSLVGEGSDATPAPGRNVVWACIQDPNHRMVVTLTWDGDPAMAPTRTTARFVVAPALSSSHAAMETFGFDHCCCRDLVLQMSQLEACCSFTPFIHI